LSLVSLFGGKLAAAPFGTFATLSARLRRADEHQECLLIGVDRKGPADGERDAIDGYLWSGRALQEVFVDLVVSGLASMYPVSSSLSD
jgi:hypothetical protein